MPKAGHMHTLAGNRNCGAPPYSHGVDCESMKHTANRECTLHRRKAHLSASPVCYRRHLCFFRTFAWCDFLPWTVRLSNNWFSIVCWFSPPPVLIRFCNILTLIWIWRTQLSQQNLQGKKKQKGKTWASSYTIRSDWVKVSCPLRIQDHAHRFLIIRTPTRYTIHSFLPKGLISFT